jgi:hypothetical protein
MQMSGLYLFASFTRVFGPRLVTTVLSRPRPPIALHQLFRDLFKTSRYIFNE